MQDYGYMANGLAKPDFICEICETKNPGFNWSDLHGEGMCNVCGTPSDLKSTPQRNNLAPKWIPVIKQYWNETKAYMGLGQIVIWRDYPECIRGRERLDRWMKAHPELLPKSEETAEVK